MRTKCLAPSSRLARTQVGADSRRGIRPGTLAGLRAAALRLAVITLLLATGAAPSLFAQDPAARVSELEARHAAARRAAVHLLAPEAFEEAASRLEDAIRAVQGGQSSAPERLARARAALAAAEEIAGRTRPRFSSAIEAREAAIEQGAETHSPDAWRTAEEELARGGERAEEGNTAAAVDHAARAAELYRRAALAARRARLLGPTLDARQAAISAGGHELAPESFAGAEEELAGAQAALEAGRPDSAVEPLASLARREFRHTARLAVLADSVHRRALSIERVVRAHEADLARLLAAAELDADVSPHDTDAVTSALAGHLRELAAEVVTLRGRLADERATSGQLADRVAELEGALTRTEERLAQVEGRLETFQGREERLRETRALFSPEEGEVLLSGDRLILRLHGLAFASGSHDITPEHEALLTRVQRVVRDYPDAAIRIEGHTDSQGSAEGNRALSRRRAIAVREYLLQRLPISSARIEAVGVGEERPIASNDDEEGRARNRRIEIVLTLS